MVPVANAPTTAATAQMAGRNRVGIGEIALSGITGNLCTLYQSHRREFGALQAPAERGSHDAGTGSAYGRPPFDRQTSDLSMVRLRPILARGGPRVLRQFVEVATVIALDAINRGAIRRRGIRCILY